MTTLLLQSSEFKPKHHESTSKYIRQSHFHSDGPNDQTDSLNISLETVSAAAAHPSLHQPCVCCVSTPVRLQTSHCVCLHWLRVRHVSGVSPAEKYSGLLLLPAQDDDFLSVTSHRCDISSLFFPSVFSQEKNHLVFLCDVFSPTSD